MEIESEGSGVEVPASPEFVRRSLGRVYDFLVEAEADPCLETVTRLSNCIRSRFPVPADHPRAKPGFVE